jgi:hypothetical protein
MPETPLEAAIVAVPETAGSALYGMVDVLSVTGNMWQTLRSRAHRSWAEREHRKASFLSNDANIGSSTL